MYRFLWDGRLLLLGENPYLTLPVTRHEDPLSASDPLLDSLYAELNSSHYFTVYPPLMQAFFALAALAGSIGGGIFLLRLLAFCVDLCLFFLCQRRGKQSVIRAFWLCPLWIYEGVGNLHLEVFAATFLILALESTRPAPRVLALMAALQSKLWPLLLWPLFLVRSRRFALWTLALLVQFPLLILMGGGDWPYPFFAGLALYSESFLFNPGPLQWLREFFELQRSTLTSAAGILAGLFALFSAQLRHRPAAEVAGNILMLYLLVSFCVHPWYILPLIVLQPWRPSVVAWSYLIFLSYLGYRTMPATVPDLVLILEYGVVTLILLLEWVCGKNSLEK